jgi:uncharacterized membrane protein YfcA
MSLLILFPLIFTASLVLTMVGLGGGLIFSPLFILLQFPVHTAVSASLFLNGIADFTKAISPILGKAKFVALAYEIFT